MAKEKEKPLTREDVLRLIEALATKEKGHELVLNRECVLRLIEENGGLENELDLSEMKFDRGIDLHDIDLKRIILTKARLVEVHLENANLREVHLEEANLRYAHLERADLSEAHLRGASLMKANLEMANLRGANLEDANLEEATLTNAHLEGADLRYAHLEGARLWSAHLEGARLWRASLVEAELTGAYLEGADFLYANLERAWLDGAHLEGTYLFGAELSSDTALQNVDWGNYILGEENKGLFDWAVTTYRQLKVWYKNAGISDIEGEFLYREMKCKRKQFWWGNTKLVLADLIHPLRPKRLLRAIFPRNPIHWALLMSYDLLCGYGERLRQIIGWVFLIVFGLAAAYYFWGSFSSSSFWDTLYYSAASFTALGYGNWAPQPTGWAKAMGAAEAFIGVFTMALFLITFVRKMTR